MSRTAVVVSLVVALAGCADRDPLFCGLHPGDTRCGPVGDGGVDDVAPGFVTIGGTVSGLAGAGLVVQNNGSDDKQILSDGPFRFASALPVGTAYTVTIGSQPTNPSQICTVTGGTGTANSDVSDVAVTCTVASYTVGGSVSGLLSATSVTLTDNGGDNTTVPAPGGLFQFPTKIASGAMYAVAVQTPPSLGGPCLISASTGTVGGGDVSTVVVNCTPGTYTIGGMVSGLNGTVKLHNGSDTISVSANGMFAFPTPVPLNGSYAVTVSTQPTSPISQTCTVTNGTGNMVGGNITAVSVTCVTNTFTIGGMISGISGTVVLRDNGGDDKSLTANGGFTFATKIASGLTYAVTVHSEPATLQCVLTGASGTVMAANITNVMATCNYTDPGIACGASYCNSAQECCDPEGTPSCIATGGTCTHLVLVCDSAADCSTAGDICCATLTGNGSSVSSNACTAATGCNGSHDIELCDPNVTGSCASGACSAFSTLPGYDACQ